MTATDPHESSASGQQPGAAGPPWATPADDAAGAAHPAGPKRAGGMQAMLAQRVFALPRWRSGRMVAHPAERAIWLRDNDNRPHRGMCSLGNREIGHFHPWDGSLHIVLAPELAEAAVTAGWAEVHPVAVAGLAPRNRVMLYGPRNEAEVDIIFSLIAAAVRRAAGHQTQHAPWDR